MPTTLLIRRLAPILSRTASWPQALAGAAVATALGWLAHAALTPAMGLAYSNVAFLPAVVCAGIWFGFRGVAAFYVFASVLWWGQFWGHVPNWPAQFATFSIGVLLVGVFVALLKSTVQALDTERAALAESQRRYAARIHGSPQFFWTTDPAGGAVERSRHMEGVLQREPQATWLQFVHPEDAPAAKAAWERCLADHSPFDGEYRQRMQGDGPWRWVRSFARYDEAGPQSLWYGVTEDIDDRKQAEAARALLMREIDHRSRNILSVVQALVRMTPRTDVESYARAVEERIVALAGAHNLLASSHWRGTDLQALLEQELRPYQGHYRLSGAPVRLRPELVQPLALVAHELATNAAKYGALSVPHGCVSVTWRLDAEALAVEWMERDGPAPAAPKRKGFGGALIAGSVGGDLSYDWAAEGLTVRFTLPDALS